MSKSDNVGYAIFPAGSRKWASLRCGRTRVWRVFPTRKAAIKATLKRATKTYLDDGRAIIVIFDAVGHVAEIRSVAKKNRYNAMNKARIVKKGEAAYDTYVGRPSKWGNPFVIGVHGDRAEVIARYDAWIRDQPELMAALPELKGKVLACHCAPKRCHAEILLNLLREQGIE